MRSFKDPYDHRKLAFHLMLDTGLRGHDALRAKVTWFEKDFTWMKMSQCKGKVTTKDGQIHIKRQPKHVPLSNALAMDLRNYIKYRLAIGYYVGGDLESMRLFPKLKKNVLNLWLYKLRKVHGKKYPFLHDIYKTETCYNNKREVISEKNFYRIAPHCCRAFHATLAYEVTNGDLRATQMLTGHQKLDNLAKYTKVIDIMERKKEMKKHLDTVTSEQLTPVLVGQKRLNDF